MNITLLKLDTKEKFKSKDAEYLRGYIGNKYREDIRFHNHISKYEFNYKMPYVQYKVINEQLHVMGINEASSLIQEKLINLKEINIGGNLITDMQIWKMEYKEEIEVVDELLEYKFETPWIALNEKNYRKYINGELDLNRLLQNNILSIFTDLGITVEKRILVKGDFRPLRLFMKDTELLGFNGIFVCNVKLPKFISVGKRRSVGYGTISSK